MRPPLAYNLPVHGAGRVGTPNCCQIWVGTPNSCQIWVGAPNSCQIWVGAPNSGQIWVYPGMVEVGQQGGLCSERCGNMIR